MFLGSGRFQGTTTFPVPVLQNQENQAAQVQNIIRNELKLGSIDFSITKVSGSLSSHVGRLTKLGALFLQASSFTGAIPESLGNCTRMLLLLLSHNKFQYRVPSEIGRLSLLRYFTVHDNAGITGTVPEEIYGLSRLEALWLGRTSLEGTLGTLIGNLSKLSCEYRIPPVSVCTWSRLQSFHFSVLFTDIALGVEQSLLTGTLPTEVSERRFEAK